MARSEVLQHRGRPSQVIETLYKETSSTNLLNNQGLTINNLRFADDIHLSAAATQKSSTSQPDSLQAQDHTE
jgi:hypothetical protein